MEWSTHALSGLIAGYMVTNDLKGAAVGAVASLIPDLDEPKSKFGKPFCVISVPLKAKYGHRTITHSFIFCLLGALIGSLVSIEVGIATAAGILAHILGDLITGRVTLFYPSPKKIGFSVSRITYICIDRLTRLLLLTIILLKLWIEIIN
ncbi:metal-dependent hydrolase [Cytobacillus horneckiae]|uniref:Metal-dependent hydrolase n=1 Tax=Cytobacillus horneckiae TaxID=549687 RepID=A0A2N0ZAZ5_9BACI|nr:metal-dependent hydrolase [Cytobacillus horneckiae]MEC1158708.1 metal-dependent hydrolase [Cytobacillus horneckiae]NRG46666.1 metal-dependent hydrolase [Bacillus sp. CRN 9]PKG26682.1 metal-dependent hydrolase [Cytobacillus horneckiae]